MKRPEQPKKSNFLPAIIQLLAIASSLGALYFLHQTQILSSRWFALVVIIYVLLSTLLILLSRRFVLILIFLFLQILLNLAVIFACFKYDNYLSQLGKHDSYTEKYSLVTTADSELVKNADGDITKVGLLANDPYKETVEQYLTQKNQGTGLLSKKLTRQDLVQFNNLLSLTSALLNQNSTTQPEQKIKTIFLGNSFLDSLKENNQDLYSKLHVLQVVEIPVTPKNIETAKNTSLDTPFTIYLSGIDNRDHTMPYAARSDVNLILVVNPAKHKILILNTPRDFYVPLAMNGQNDKLTHAGLYGVNESIHTLENFYQIKINYYARINFDAFSSIIDQLGGVDVTIPYTVNTYHGGRHYAPGSYHLNGDEALDFARERVSISWAGGDRERGRNQEKILSAVIKKLQTDVISLSKFDQIFASVAKNIQTNFTSSDIKYLVQKQLVNLTNWQIEMIDVDGKADITSTYTYPEPKHFVWHPYVDSVEKAKNKLQEYQNNHP